MRPAPISPVVVNSIENIELTMSPKCDREQHAIVDGSFRKIEKLRKVLKKSN